MTEIKYVANALLEAWFPKRHSDKGWLESDDGQNWQEIAFLDAAVAIDAYIKWQEENKGK